MTEDELLPFAKTAASRYCRAQNRHDFFEDAVQIACLYMLEPERRRIWKETNVYCFVSMKNAICAAYDALYRTRVKSTRVFSKNIDTLSRCAFNVDDGFEQIEMDDLLTTAFDVAELDASQRDIVRRFMKGESYRDITNTTGASTTKVTKTLNAVRYALEELVDDKRYRKTLRAARPTSARPVNDAKHNYSTTTRRSKSAY